MKKIWLLDPENRSKPKEKKIAGLLTVGSFDAVMDYHDHDPDYTSVFFYTFTPETAAEIERIIKSLGLDPIDISEEVGGKNLFKFGCNQSGRIKPEVITEQFELSGWKIEP